MRDDLIRIVKILGVSYNEIFIDIDVDGFTINSLEIRDGSAIVLHSFVNDMDLEFFYDDLIEEDRKTIYRSLCSFLYN
jgi:hypothetical protein